MVLLLPFKLLFIIIILLIFYDILLLILGTLTCRSSNNLRSENNLIASLGELHFLVYNK